MPPREQETAKKRKSGRLAKAMGDYCLLAGSPRNAIEQYSYALELSRGASDFIWIGSAQEGLMCAKVTLSSPHPPFSPAERSRWSRDLRRRPRFCTQLLETLAQKSVFSRHRGSRASLDASANALGSLDTSSGAAVAWDCSAALPL
jgi:hypothetical protein